MIYVCGAIVVVLIILLICRSNKKEKPNKGILVEINAEVIKVDAKTLADELKSIRKSIKKVNTCQGLGQQIKKAMKNLSIFIRENPPENTNRICTMDFSADVINQQMQFSVTPDDRDIMTAYNTVLEQESVERNIDDPEELMKYLLNNIDVVVKMLQFDICQNGILNLDKLYSILEQMYGRVCAIGADYDDSQKNVHPPNVFPSEFPLYAMRLAKYRRYDTPPNLPTFIQEGPIMEPFQNRTNTTRSRRTLGHNNEMNSLKRTSNSQPDFSTQTMIVPTDPPQSKQFDKRYAKNLAASYRQPPSQPLPPDQLAYSEPITLSKFPPNRQPQPKMYPLGKVNSYQVYDKYNTQYYTPACDDSFEGSVGCDILGYKPPGHIISQLYDKDDHYTVNQNSCASNTTDPRSTATCYVEDLAMINALAGQPEQMLDCVGDCYREPNYFRWYHKMNTATKDMEFILNPEE